MHQSSVYISSHCRGGSDGPATPAMAGPLLGPAFRSLPERKNTFARFLVKVVTLYSKIHIDSYIILCTNYILHLISINTVHSIMERFNWLVNGLTTEEMAELPLHCIYL